MALVTKQDMIDHKGIRLAANIRDEVIDPCIWVVFEWTAFEPFPYKLAMALFELHKKTGALSAAETNLKAYFDLHLKSYYMMAAFLDYITAGSEAILTASGFRIFKEMQSDPADAAAYAQILNKYSGWKDAAKNRAVNKLVNDKYIIDGVDYSSGRVETVPIRRKQRHFTVITPNADDYEQRRDDENRYLSPDGFVRYYS